MKKEFIKFIYKLNDKVGCEYGYSKEDLKLEYTNYYIDCVHFRQQTPLSLLSFVKIHHKHKVEQSLKTLKKYNGYSIMEKFQLVKLISQHLSKNIYSKSELYQKW